MNTYRSNCAVETKWEVAVPEGLSVPIEFGEEEDCDLLNNEEFFIRCEEAVKEYCDGNIAGPDQGQSQQPQTQQQQQQRQAHKADGMCTLRAVAKNDSCAAYN